VQNIQVHFDRVLHVAGIEAVTLKMEAVAVSKSQEAALQGALHSARSLS
jgi:hypothetical protein